MDRREELRRFSTEEHREERTPEPIEQGEYQGNTAACRSVRMQVSKWVVTSEMEGRECQTINFKMCEKEIFVLSLGSDLRLKRVHCLS